MSAERVYLTESQIYDADDVAEWDFYVPAWGGWVRLKQLTLQDEYDLRREAMIGGKIDEALLDALFVIVSLIEPKMDRSRARELVRKNRAAMSDLIKEINRVNKRTPEEVRALEAGFPQEPDQGVRIPPSESAAYDGPDAAGEHDAP